jgi:hypothetical protein
MTWRSQGKQVQAAGHYPDGQTVAKWGSPARSVGEVNAVAG